MMGGWAKYGYFLFWRDLKKNQSTSQNHENQNLMAYVRGHFWP
jgi:hypothetical protein